MSGDFEYEIEEAVMRVIARAANHQILREHFPIRVARCPECEIAQMIENMMRSLLQASGPSVGSDRFDGGDASTVRPEAPTLSPDAILAAPVAGERS